MDICISAVIQKQNKTVFFNHTTKITSLMGKRASLVAQMVKNLHAMQGTCVQSLGQEDPLEKGVATHSSILAWRIPMDSLQSMGSQRVGYD